MRNVFALPAALSALVLLVAVVADARIRIGPSDGIGGLVNNGVITTTVTTTTTTTTTVPAALVVTGDGTNAAGGYGSPNGYYWTNGIVNGYMSFVRTNATTTYVSYAVGPDRYMIGLVVGQNGWWYNEAGTNPVGTYTTGGGGVTGSPIVATP